MARQVGRATSCSEIEHQQLVACTSAAAGYADGQVIPMFCIGKNEIPVIDIT